MENKYSKEAEELAAKYVAFERKEKKAKAAKMFNVMLGHPLVSVLCGTGYYVVCYLLTYMPKLSFFLALYVSAIVNAGLNLPEYETNKI